MTGNKPARVVLQDRDRYLFRELATMRVIDREQAKLVAGFRSTSRVNARLLMLTRAGYLRRFFAGTISGGRKAIYSLSLKSAPLVDLHFQPWKQKQREVLVADPFLDHQFRVNSVFLILKYRPIPQKEVHLRHWLSFSQPLSRPSPLIPDGYFELDTSSGVRAAFVEVDLGTETSKAWRRKTQGYLRLALTGEFEQQFGQHRFRVLVITSTQRRLEGIRKLVSKHTDKIFWFSTFDTIEGEGFWSPIWQRPSGNQRLSLV